MLIALTPFWFSIRVLLAHWLSSLARNEGKKEQVTSGNRSVLQSIIGTSERLIAETVCAVYYCADNLKLSSCATESHWKGFWQPDPSSCVSPKFSSKRWMRKYNSVKKWKIRTWVVWPGSGPFLLNVLCRNQNWDKSETRIL